VTVLQVPQLHTPGRGQPPACSMSVRWAIYGAEWVGVGVMVKIAAKMARQLIL